MTFDKKAFLELADSPWLGLTTIADEFERLHAEIAALKAERKAEEEPWGWAVLDENGDPFTCFGFCSYKNLEAFPNAKVLWFETEEAAGVLLDALNAGYVAKLNRNTLEKI